MEYAHRMREPGVTCGRKYELRDAQLLDASKTLHIRGVQQRPNAFINQAIVVKDDEAMNWVPDPLGLH